MTFKFQNVLVLGATSGICQAISQNLCTDQCSFTLVARTDGKLQSIAADLKVRGAKSVQIVSGDLSDIAGQPALMERAWPKSQSFDLAIVAYGIMFEQEECQAQPALTVQTMNVNSTSRMTLCELLATRFLEHKRGMIIGISSVAGDRGRQSNYIYGASKAAFTAYLSGLRSRMFKQGIHVMTVKPGIIDTPMTAHIEKRPFVVAASVAAQHIVAAARSKRDVVYAPPIWCWIMHVIKLIPEALFKKTKL
jgi:decaprenylphospho-beta-D-erythro-pentofuranosid-2-ulose 2-reductase